METVLWIFLLLGCAAGLVLTLFFLLLILLGGDLR